MQNVETESDLPGGKAKPSNQQQLVWKPPSTSQSGDPRVYVAASEHDGQCTS